MKKRFELTEDDRRYLDGLMHDIRQPMQVLGVKVPRLSNALAASPVSEDMAAIAGAIKQEHLLISEIMRKLGYDPRPDAAISSELRETTLLGLLEPLQMMGEQNRDMRIELPTDDLKLFTKPADLYRIVSNLVLNALRHSHGSEVRVSAETDVFDLKLRVTDDGRGFPSGREQMLMRWAMEPSSRPSQEMSGSGLPSCLNLAEALGGKLSLERASKAGTTWLLVIPNVVVSELAPPQGFAADELRGKVVAVLDDQKAAAESIGQKFRSVGATVVVANSEMDLLRRIHRHEPAPALYMLDLVLGDGIMLGRALDTLASIDGALASAVIHTAHPHMAQTVSERVAGVVPKPLQDRHFRALVDYAAGRARPLQWALREADAK